RPRPAAGWYGRSLLAPMPARSAGSAATPVTRWTGGSAVTASAGSTRAPRRSVSPVALSAPRSPTRRAHCRGRTPKAPPRSACGKLGIRLIHSTPHRPQGRGKIERWFRGVREQFLVEVADSSPEQLAERGLSPAAALLELNALFTAWVESVYHHRVHSETAQT